MSAKRYIVRLSEEERARLKALLRQNRLAAQKRTRAQVLLKVDEGEEGPAWTDAQAAAAALVHSCPALSQNDLLATRPGYGRRHTIR